MALNFGPQPQAQMPQVPAFPSIASLVAALQARAAGGAPQFQVVNPYAGGGGVISPSMSPVSAISPTGGGRVGSGMLPDDKATLEGIQNLITGLEEGDKSAREKASSDAAVQIAALGLANAPGGGQGIFGVATGDMATSSDTSAAQAAGKFPMMSGSMVDRGLPVMQGLVDRGYSPAVAAGMAGSLAQESGFNPSIVGDNGASIGYAQWQGPRHQALVNFATAMGKSPTDPDAQLAFMVSELQGSERRAGQALAGATTPEQAALIHSNLYERPNAQYANNGRRQAYGRQIFDAWQAQQGGQGAPQGGLPQTAPFPPARPTDLSAWGGVPSPQLAQASYAGSDSMTDANNDPMVSVAQMAGTGNIPQNNFYSPGRNGQPVAGPAPVQGGLPQSASLPPPAPSSVLDQDAARYGNLQALNTLMQNGGAPVNRDAGYATYGTASQPGQYATYSLPSMRQGLRDGGILGAVGNMLGIGQAQAQPQQPVAQVPGWSAEQNATFGRIMNDPRVSAQVKLQAVQMARQQAENASKLGTVSPGQYLTRGGQPIPDGKGGWLKTPDKEAEQPAAIREYEYARGQGFTGSFTDFQAQKAQAGRTQVNIDQKAQSAEEQERGKTFVGLMESQWKGGVEAGAQLKSIGELRGALERLGSNVGNPVAGIRSWLASKGVAVEGKTDLDIVSSFVDRMTPQQRQGLPGAASDTDVKMFKNSLPSLLKSPQANKIIVDTVEGLARAQAQRAQIAGDYFAGTIDRPEAIRRSLAIGNGMDAFDTWRTDEEKAGRPIPEPSQTLPSLKTQGDIDALPKGSQFIWTDGKTYRKD